MMQMLDPNETSKWTLPNLLTGFRFVAAPFLLWLAWNEYAVAFMILSAVAFLTDLLDGWTARLTGQVSEFGAVLDSWADVITYLTIALSCWWLWPEIVAREWFYVVLIVASCLLPSAAGLLKFGRFTSYHTWGVKLAAASMGGSLYLMFLSGPIWPFRVAAVICILAAFEEIVITLLLKSPSSDVRSLWHVVRKVNGER
ncbi:CDP-alcohol phosphatidyltransferase family protein [Methylotuvimicrobium sp. KM2]|uniref:CDP-alcohol phosphatidyltransferase family protein n=1 Tax=Methylotuvimicrobium sp. KM2 TaxID=3133976 RepID=UPI003101744B